MKETYLSPTQEAGRDFFLRHLKGNVMMLNLLRFRNHADYSGSPELKPEHNISGEQAFERYIHFTLPFLKASGGEIMFYGKGGPFLIGPASERWDAMLLIRQHSAESFLQFASNAEYLKGLGHRTAALEDSRLLPLSEASLPE